MKLTIMMVTYRRVMMTLDNIDSYILARQHALDRIDGLEIDFHLWAANKNEYDNYVEIYKDIDWITVSHVPNYATKAPILVEEFVTRLDSDLVHLTWDDHTPAKNVLTLGVRDMVEHFPKFDGVVGMMIVNHPPEWGWQTSYGPTQIIGVRLFKDFRERTGQPILCPEYHQCCFEVEFTSYMQLLNRVWHCREAHFNHQRHELPSKWGIDHSAMESRKLGTMNKDRAVYNVRRKKGYYWGINFDIVGGWEAVLPKLKAEEEGDEVGVE